MRALTREGSFRPAPGGAIAVLALGGALVFWGWMSPAWGGEAQPGPSAPADQGPSLAEQLENDPILLFRFALRDFQRGLYVRALPLLARFVEKFPEHSEHQRAIYMLADAHFFIATTGVPAEYMNAVAIYQLALQRYPQAPQMPMAYFRMGQAYQAQKRAAEAQVAFRTLLEKAPTSTLAPRAQIEIAKRYVELGDPRSAIVEFEKVLKNYKGSPSEREAHFGIADALFRQGFYPRALEQFESGDKRWPDFLRLHGDHLYNYAETLFQTRRFARAADAYLRMVNIDPSNEFTNRALARLGDLYHREGRREDALKVYSRVLDKYPLSEGGLVSLIRIADMAVEEEVKLPESHIFPLEALRNPLDGYKKVIELAPTHQLAEVALLRIASYHLKRGEIQKAIATVEEFLIKYPASQLINNAYFLMAKAHFDQVSRFYQRRQFLRAVQTYAVFRSKVPTPVTRQANPYKTMLEVGESYMRLGLYEQAGKMFEEILSEPEGVVAVGDEVLFRFAHAALLTGDRAKAKALATRFVNAFPRSGRLASVRAIQGEIAWVERDPRSAAVLLKEALGGELDNEIRGRSLFLLAEASSQIGLYSEAVEAMRKAIALYPEIAGSVKPFSLEQASYRLGDILYESRRWLSALMAYKSALEFFPKSDLSGWAFHRIARIQDELNLARASASPAGAAAVAEGANPFWRDVNRVRSESEAWDRRNLSRLEEVLRETARN